MSYSPLALTLPPHLHRSICRIFILWLLAFLFPFTSSWAKSNDFLINFAQEWIQEEKNLKKEDKVQENLTLGLRGKAPLGEPKGPIPSYCQPHEFQNYILNNYKDPLWYASEVKRFFKTCSSYFRRGQTKGILGLLEFATTEYDISKNPLIHQKNLRLSDGTMISAYFGIKDLTLPRPWVILKCGVFCDITDSRSSLNYLMSYFDQSPFNVIFVSNHTGTEHIKTNRALTIAGFYEVYDFYDIAHWLKYESPYQSLVDSIHAVGISLGGSAALATGHLSQLYLTDDNKPLFNSATALCPVVNLGPTLKDMYSETRKGRIFTKMTWSALKEVEPYLPEARDYLQQKQSPPASFFPGMLSGISIRYGYGWDLRSPPRRQAPLLDKIQDYWSWNHFGESSFQTEVPTLVWASHDDRVVNFSLNTKTIIDSPDQSRERGAIGVEFGDHCGFSSAYGLTTTTSVLQTFILSHSENFRFQRKTLSSKMPATATRKWGNELNLRYGWEAHPNKDSVTLFSETFNPLMSWLCLTKDPFKSAGVCRRRQQWEIPLRHLGAFGAKTPSNSTEAEILSRQLNGAVHLTFNGTPIEGTIFAPNRLEWEDYQSY